jgi:hypothetical protein
MAKYFHGTYKHNLKSIGEEGLGPSDDSVTAGASGVYLAKTRESAQDWGDHIVHVEVPDNLKIHPDITLHPDLELTRRRNQYSNELGELDKEDLKDYYEPEERDETKAADVSQVLESQGYHGHYDSMVNHGDMVVYQPEKLKVLGVTTNTGKFHHYDKLSRQFDGLK